MVTEFLFQGGKVKALTFSYDDGQVFDRRLVELFNRYQMKSTFHLNSGKIGKEGYVGAHELTSLYQGHEVACHGKEHCYLRQLTKEQMIKEIWEDRSSLEGWMKQLVVGMSYAFGEYSESAIKTLECLGIQYSRTVESTGYFCLPDHFMRWQPTCHHNDHILDKADRFLNLPEYMRLPLFYIWGHSFEFERENNWDLMEAFCEKVAFKEDVWYATNIEIKNYICAMRSVIFSLDESLCYNPSGISVWLKTAQDIIELKPGETLAL